MNRGHEYHAIVRAGEDATPLLTYLVERYRHSTIAQWRARILEGSVMVDDRRATPQLPLIRGQRVSWRRPPWQEPSAPIEYAVVHRDADLLAVNKPAGLPVLPGAGFLENTLLWRVRANDPLATPMHRLGRWTSGLVLFARTREARTRLAHTWRARRIKKRYRTLALGTPARGELTVNVPIGPVPHPLLGTIHAACQRGRPAYSRVTVVEQREGAFLADVRITTGRPHQIRIHLAAAGFPLVGDPVYREGGLPSADCAALPGDPGYRLHSTSLVFEHPATGTPLRLECPPPRTLLRRAEQLHGLSGNDS